ncbi:MAG: hypothetical protein RLZZ283_87 [Candidatus Parcubacteria bacterium]|jgi:glycosyltransferase involved in cell wall biosynthesis
MRVLMLSTDSNMLDTSSRVYRRTRAYADLVESIVVVLVGSGQAFDRTDGKVRVIRFAASNKIVALFALWFQLPAFAWSEKIDIVTTQDPLWCGLLGVRVKQKNRIPLQVQIHTDFRNPQYMHESLMRRIESVLPPYVLRRASSVRIVSERMRADAERLSRAPVRTLPVMIDVDSDGVTARPSEYGAYPIALMVCRLVREKNVAVAIEALSTLSDMHLYIVGDGPLRATLEEKARVSGVAHRVHFLGWKQTVRPYFEHASCFLSLSAYEGYGLSLAEAALFGCPIIATDAGLAGAELRDQEHVTLVNAHKYDVRMALKSVVENAEAASVRARAARAAIESVRLPPAVYAERYVGLLSECLLDTMHR